MTALVTVFPDRYARGWPEYRDEGVCTNKLHARAHVHTYGECSRGIVGPLSGALIQSFGGDAHFVAYPSPNSRRLTMDALDVGTPISLQVAVFDFDDPASHGSPVPAGEAWRQEFRSRISELWKAHPNFFAHESKGGGRIIYLLPRPMIIQSREDAMKWRQLYAITCCYFSRVFGLVADESCSDATHFFRLPYVVRDGVRQQWQAWGADPDKIGALNITATEADRDAAKILSPTAFRVVKRGRHQRRTPRKPSQTRGIFYHAVHARGHVVGPHDSESFVILCPNRHEHSVDTEGTSSTLLYLPGAGDEVGMVHCKHKHCREKTVRDWLRFFSEEELEAARKLAGVEMIEWPKFELSLRSLQ